MTSHSPPRYFTLPELSRLKALDPDLFLRFGLALVADLAATATATATDDEAAASKNLLNLRAEVRKVLAQ